MIRPRMALKTPMENEQVRRWALKGLLIVGNSAAHDCSAEFYPAEAYWSAGGQGLAEKLTGQRLVRQGAPQGRLLRRLQGGGLRPRGSLRQNTYLKSPNFMKSGLNSGEFSYQTIF